MTDGVFTLDFPARADYLVLARLALTGIARLASSDEEAVSDLRLAVTEAAANACHHAYPGNEVGTVSIRFELRGPRLEVLVEDDGAGFDETAADQLNPDDLGVDGMGLAIIRAVADDVEVGPRSNGSGTTVRFSRILR